MKKRDKPGVGPTDEDWNSPGGRLRWLLRERWGGQRANMARDIGVSLTGLTNVITEAQEPGRRLMEAIAGATDVNPGWMLTGQGPPFKSSALAVAHQVLPGSPQQHPDLLTKEKVDHLGDLYSPSRYWLRVQSGEPIVQAQAQKIRKSDLLLLETDRAHFFLERWRSETLCVIRVPRTNPPKFKLAEVEFFGGNDDSDPVSMQADTFDLVPQVITQIVIEETPSGDLRAFKQRVRGEEGTKPRKRPRGLASEPEEMGCPLLAIKDVDIVAVCVLIVRTCMPYLSPTAGS